MAAFCLLGLLLALGAVALAGLRPWASDSVVPDLSVTPGLGAGLDEAIALAPAEPVGIAQGRVAPSRSGPTVAPAIAAPAPPPTASAPQPAVALAPARAVGGSTAVPVSAPPAEVPAAPAPAPVAAVPEPVPVSTPPPAPPVLAGVGGGGHGGPGTAGGGGLEPEPACEGDEYTVTISYEAEPLSEELVEILVERLEADGSMSELYLEGDLSDARALIELLSGAGSCVEVLFAAVESTVPELPLEDAPD